LHRFNFHASKQETQVETSGKGMLHRGAAGGRMRRQQFAATATSAAHAAGPATSAA
jgi:hypothetical protein